MLRDVIVIINGVERNDDDTPCPYSRVYRYEVEEGDLHRLMQTIANHAIEGSQMYNDRRSKERRATDEHR